VSAGQERTIAGPEAVARDLRQLEGLLKGIALDGKILPVEAVALREWCGSGGRDPNRPPFREVVAKVEAAVADGVLDEEERADLLWMCDRATSPNAYHDLAGADMDRLHGLLAGVGADRRVTKDELEGIRAWMDTVQYLKGTWPYDETDAILTNVLADGRIDEDEHEFLVAYTRSFLEGTAKKGGAAALGEAFLRYGACAVNPMIRFPKRRFCVTGTGPPAARSRVARAIAQLEGVPVLQVRVDLDYLVVAAERDVSWAFSCFGRKVEEAIALRQEGAPVTIVHEEDVWKSAAELGVKRPA
jgi:hypothetical protein